MSLIPRSVLTAMEQYYADFPGCAGRSLHRFAEEVGRRYESARTAFGRFLGRNDPQGVVFLRNATEAINLVGQGLPWQRGDRVLISDREHNSNLIVWQRLAQERGSGWRSSSSESTASSMPRSSNAASRTASGW